jgi:ABC-type phosphate transport system substrate-binding protein
VVNRSANGLRLSRRAIVGLALIAMAVLLLPASASAALDFEPPVTYPVGGGNTATEEGSGPIVAADFNGDGHPDLAIAHESNHRNTADIRILMNAGNGTFAAPVVYEIPPKPTSMVAVDLNRDGKEDLVVATQGGKQIAILLGRGDGTFAPAVKRSIGIGEKQELAVGDFNGDGKADLALTESYFQSGHGNQEIAILLGNGEGGFGKLTSFAAAGEPRGIAVTDLNGDSNQDLVVTASNGSHYFLGNGDGTFGAPVAFSAEEPAYSLIAAEAEGGAVADFNGDGYGDVATTSEQAAPGDAVVRLGDGKGDLGPPVSFAVGTQPQHLAAADFDGNGSIDLAVSNYRSDDVSVLINSSGAPPSEPSCSGADIRGGTSTLQALLQQQIWVPQFNALCAGGNAVQYTSGIGEGGRGWLSDFRTKSFPPGEFGAVDEAPDRAEIEGIDGIAEGAHEVVIPVAQTAIAIVADPPPNCSITRITNEDLEHVFRGNFLTWGRISTASGSGCDAPITRVVRAEVSNTTYQFKRYLGIINPKVLACSGGRTWDEMSRPGQPLPFAEEGEPQNAWPGQEEPLGGDGKCQAGEGRLSSVDWVKNLERFDGNLRIAEAAANGPGTIGYVPLPDAMKVGATHILEVQDNGWRSASEAQFASPAEGGNANCAGAHYKVPQEARRVAGASGTDAEWLEGSGALHPAVGGGAYPLCTLTFDLALHRYGDVHDKGGVDTAPSYTYAEIALLKQYLREFVLAPEGQKAITKAGIGFASLPTAPFADHDVLAAARYASGKISY